MKAKEWKELILSKEEDIKKEMENAFKMTITAKTNYFGGTTESVIIDEEGNIRTSFLSQNETPIDVFHGTAIILAKFEYDNVHNYYSRIDWLTPEEEKKYFAWIEENEEFEYLGSKIEEWNPDIAERIDNDMIECMIDNCLDDSVNTAWENMFAQLELLEKEE